MACIISKSYSATWQHQLEAPAVDSTATAPTSEEGGSWPFGFQLSNGSAPSRAHRTRHAASLRLSLRIDILAIHNAVDTEGSSEEPDTLFEGGAPMDTTMLAAESAAEMSTLNHQVCDESFGTLHPVSESATTCATHLRENCSVGRKDRRRCHLKAHTHLAVPPWLPALPDGRTPRRCATEASQDSNRSSLNAGNACQWSISMESPALRASPRCAYSHRNHTADGRNGLNAHCAVFPMSASEVPTSGSSSSMVVPLHDQVACDSDELLCVDSESCCSALSNETNSSSASRSSDSCNNGFHRHSGKDCDVGDDLRPTPARRTSRKLRSCLSEWNAKLESSDAVSRGSRTRSMTVPCASAPSPCALGNSNGKGCGTYLDHAEQPAGSSEALPSHKAEAVAEAAPVSLQEEMEAAHPLCLPPRPATSEPHPSNTCPRECNRNGSSLRSVLPGSAQVSAPSTCRTPRRKVWQRLSCDGLPGGFPFFDSLAASTPPMNATTAAPAPISDMERLPEGLIGSAHCAGGRTLDLPLPIPNSQHLHTDATTTPRAPLKVIRWAEDSAVTISESAVSLEAAWVESFKEASAAPLSAAKRTVIGFTRSTDRQTDVMQPTRTVGACQKLEHRCSAAAAEILCGREDADVAEQQCASPRLLLSLFRRESADKSTLQQVKYAGTSDDAAFLSGSGGCKLYEEERGGEAEAPWDEGGSKHSAVHFSGQRALGCMGRVQTGCRAEWSGQRGISSLVTRVLRKGNSSMAEPNSMCSM